MKQEQFEARFTPEWEAFEAWLKHARLPGRARRKQPAPFAAAELPERYRQLCSQLALARSRDYGPAIVDRLARLAHQGHDVLYGTPAGWLRAWFAFLAGGFAREVRARWRSVLIASLLFYGPFIALRFAVREWPDFAFVVLPESQLNGFDDMYGPAAEALGRTRDAGDDLSMFGFYIANNIGIGFRTFATGIAYGLGSLFFLLYNGVFMGVVEGHVVNLGHAQRFYSFVAGHSSFELTAITLCGAAGLQLGWALLAPGELSRAASLRRAGRASVPIVAGAAAMLVIAAGIEAFWSPRVLDLSLKAGVGLFNWALVIAYMLFAGRARGR
ncbi:stage II sporulation protein M [Niveibacterium sp. SC-1]|uniref:stage II sporulation protein M n=1 Tax=Niveibacterium sp. SC-1 TaxID=3135646 RepID=UPI00311FE887